MSDRGLAIRNRISDNYEKTAGFLIYDFTEAVGQTMEEQDAEITEIREDLDASTLTGDALEKFTYQHKGVSRKAATYATGSLTVTGTGTITTGDLFETSNGVQFKATETVTITTSGTVSIQAVIAGNSGVVGANTITEMPVTLEGIVSCNNSAATSGGYDAESDESLYERYITKLTEPNTGANVYAYKQWALEVSGVGGAEVFALGHGNNTVDVVIIDDDKQPASSTLVSQVQAYIDPNNGGIGAGAAPIGARCYVSAATALNINITVTIDTEEEHTPLETAIKANITSYLESIAFTGRNVSYAQIGNAIIDTEGVIDYTSLLVNGGTSNITVQDRYVAILGTVVFSYA